MTISEREPAIVGAGLTGMLISDQLSKAGISHLLIGEPPDDNPRIGESLDPAGTLELLERYPEYDDYYYKKRGISVFTGDVATACDFSQSLPRSLGLRMMGYRSPPEFIDIDRIGFDQALYEAVVAKEHCRRLDSLVDSVDYDRDSDTVKAIGLDSGETVEPSYVFDCTFFARLLGKAMDIPVNTLSDPQRVVFTDYHAPAPKRTDGLLDDKVAHADHLVRLYADIDGLDGLAWAIPIGSYVSVGISLPQDQEAPAAEAVLTRVEDAYRRRGMDFLDVFDKPRQAIDIPHQQYFIHERAFGGNWLLAGPSYGYFWFPSASGVTTSLVAAHLAPQVLKRPIEVGQRYQDYVDELKTTHDVFDRVITRDQSDINEELVAAETNRIIAENVKRVGRLAVMRKGPLARGAARLLMKVANLDGVVKGDCKVRTANLSQQAEAIFADE